MNRLALLCFICLIDFIVVRSACPHVPGFNLESLSGQSVTGYNYNGVGWTLDYTICGTISTGGGCGSGTEICANQPTNCTGICQRWQDEDGTMQGASLGRFESATTSGNIVSLKYVGGDPVIDGPRITYINLTCDPSATTLQTVMFDQPPSDGHPSGEPYIYTIGAKSAALCSNPNPTPQAAPVSPPRAAPISPPKSAPLPQPDGELLNYCLSNFSSMIPGSIAPCIHIKKAGCFDLTAELTMGDKVIFGPRELPFRLILLSGQTQYCMENIPQLPTIKACVNLTKLAYNETLKRLNVCTEVSVSSSILPIARTIPLKCIDINDCDLPKVCPKACSSVGKCNMGVCRCDEGHYGLDCGYSTQDNCFEGVGVHTCFTTKQLSCGQVDVELTQQNQPKSNVFKSIGPMDTAVVEFPCNTTSPDKFDCKDCFSLRNVKVIGKALQGYPSVDTMCGGILINFKQSKTPVTLLQSYASSCEAPVASPTPDDPPPPQAGAPTVPVPVRPPPVPQAPLPEPPISFIDRAKQNKGTLIIAAVVVVVILIALAGVGFYFYKRCVRSNQASTSGYYQGLAEVDPLDDDGPINLEDGDADAVDYSFESTDSD